MNRTLSRTLILAFWGLIPIRAGTVPSTSLGKARSEPLLFLQGNAPGEWLERGKWIPGWDKDASGRASFRYRQEPEPQSDSCCGRGGLEGGFQSRAGRSVLGAFLETGSSGYRDTDSGGGRARFGQAGAEAGIWLNWGGGFFKGAGLSIGAAGVLEEDIQVSRASDFADITDFSKFHRELLNLVSTWVLSFGEARYLRMAASYSGIGGGEETGNSVRFDDVGLREFDSMESEAQDLGSRQFGGEADFLIRMASGRILDFSLRSRLIVGRDEIRREAGDSLHLGVGAGWLASVQSGPIGFHIAPSADFGAVFFTSPGNTDFAYLGFLKPLDQERSRKTFRIQAPQRLEIRLGGRLKLYCDYSVAVVYWTETDGSVSKSSAFSLDTQIRSPMVAFEPDGRFSVAFKPLGRLDAPGAELHLIAALR